MWFFLTVNNMESIGRNLTNDTFPEEGEDRLYTDDLYDCPPIEEKSAVQDVAKITAISVVMVISFVGNILIICVTRRTRCLRKIAYSFVVNMAIADLLTTIINMPESLTVEIRNTNQWLPGDVGVVLCKLLPFCQQVCAFCSILSLLAIALDRYFAICLPLKRIMSERLSKVIIVFTWLIPIISSAPMFVANNVVEDEGAIFCVEEWPDPFDSDKAPTDYTIILFVLFYLLPLIVISSLYSCAVFRIWRRKAPGNRSKMTNQVFSRSRQKALKMFITTVVCFALCWLPYHVAFFLMSYNKTFTKCGLPVDIYFISPFFTHAISAFNPCIYMIFNKDYRTGSKRLLASCCCKHSSAVYPDISTATRVHSRTEANERHEMTSISLQSQGFNITRFRRRKVQPSDHDPPRHVAFIVPDDQGSIDNNGA